MEPIYLTFGMIPDDFTTIAEEHIPYPMRLNGPDFAVVQSAVNQGIDAHLETVRFSQNGNHIVITDAASLKTLIRRLVEMWGTDDEQSEVAGSLADSIMSTIGVEWV